MNQCTIGNVMSHAAALQCQSQLEQRDRKLYAVLPVLEGGGSIYGVPFIAASGYKVETDTRCYAGADFNAFWGLNWEQAKSCAERLSAVVGQEYMAKPIERFGCYRADHYRVVLKK